MENEHVVPEKVKTYERFLNEQLKADLNTVLKLREKHYEEIAEYIQVKGTIENIVEKTKDTNEVLELKTKIDLGCNFYVNATIPDTSKIFISIGYGFYLEMTLQEALKFIDKKINFLQTQVDDLTKQSSKIKANIRFVLEALKEVQQLDFKVESNKRVDL